MLIKIDFIKDWRCFKQEECFNFKPGVNLLVGDQGTGKSSLLHCIRAYKEKEDEVVKLSSTKPTITASFDFEYDSLRKRGSLEKNNSGILKLQLASIWSSHGESVNYILSTLNKVDADCILMDEPDMALSIRSIVKLSNLIKEVGQSKQIIAAVHNPFLIREVEEVLDLESRSWINSKLFIEKQLTT